MLEITCIDGSFEVPTAGLSSNPQCIDSSSGTIVCNSPPPPPAYSGLEYVFTGKIKFRPGEKAYYVCTNPEAIIQSNNGTNMFEVTCPDPINGQYNFDSDLASGIGWPNCTVEPVCDILPDPPANTKLIKATKGDKVRLGENVVYECKDKAKYWETPNYVSVDEKFIISKK